MRGLQFDWGPAMAANTQTTVDLVLKILRLNIPFTITLSFIILIRDSPIQTATSALISIGIPNFPGMKLFAECIYTICFGVWLASSMESNYTFMTLVATLLFKLSTWLHFPKSILELFNPLYFPPMFNSPHKANSLRDFWGKRWHLMLQRFFLTSGGKPMVWIAKKIEAKPDIQRLAGLFGTFAASGLLHEYS